MHVLTFIPQDYNEQRFNFQKTNKVQSTKNKVQRTKLMKVVLLIAGILLATIGGVITYRAIYLDPRSGVVITEKGVREIPNYSRIIGGTILLVGGVGLAFLAVRRRRAK